MTKKNSKTDICTDEIQFLVNTSGLENFGFSFTRNSEIQDFGSGAAFDGFTRTMDLGIQHCGLPGSEVMDVKIH